MISCVIMTTENECQLDCSGSWSPKFERIVGSLETASKLTVSGGLCSHDVLTDGILDECGRSLL